MGYPGKPKWAVQPALAVVPRYGLAFASVATALGTTLILRHYDLPPRFISHLLKIEKYAEDQTIIFRLSGRMRFDGLLELKRELDGLRATPVLDLKEVTHVDLDVVHFLSSWVQQGIELRNCASYIREWIRREQGRRMGKIEVTDSVEAHRGERGQKKVRSCRI
jgi:hypothetical protein